MIRAWPCYEHPRPRVRVLAQAHGTPLEPRALERRRLAALKRARFPTAEVRVLRSAGRRHGSTPAFAHRTRALVPNEHGGQEQRRLSFARNLRSRRPRKRGCNATPPCAAAETATQLEGPRDSIPHSWKARSASCVDRDSELMCSGQRTVRTSWGEDLVAPSCPGLRGRSYPGRMKTLPPESGL